MPGVHIAKTSLNRSVREQRSSALSLRSPGSTTAQVPACLNVHVPSLCSLRTHVLNVTIHFRMYDHSPVPSFFLLQL